MRMLRHFGLRLNFEPTRETTVFCVSPSTTNASASPMNIQILHRDEVLKTLKCPTAYRPRIVFLSERVKCPIRDHVVKRF